MGGGTKTISLKGDAKKADELVGKAYREDFEAFKNDTMPLVEQQIASLSDNSMVKQALGDNISRNKTLAEGMERSKARYGVGMGAAQRGSLGKRMARNSAANSADTVNNARLEQKDRNVNVALNLAQQGSTYRSQALNEMVSAVSGESNRAVGNAQSAAAAKSANIGTAMNMASMAMAV